MISVNFVFLKGEIAESCQIINLLRVPIYVMPESQNLPMTTREPISDAKAREFLLPSSAGAPTITDAAAKERSPELWVTLLI